MKINTMMAQDKVAIKEKIKTHILQATPVDKDQIQNDSLLSKKNTLIPWDL